MALSPCAPIAPAASAPAPAATSATFTQQQQLWAFDVSGALLHFASGLCVAATCPQGQLCPGPPAAAPWVLWPCPHGALGAASADTAAVSLAAADGPFFLRRGGLTASAAAPPPLSNSSSSAPPMLLLPPPAGAGLRPPPGGIVNGSSGLSGAAQVHTADGGGSIANSFRKGWPTFLGVAIGCAAVAFAMGIFYARRLRSAREAAAAARYGDGKSHSAWYTGAGAAVMVAEEP